MAGECWLICQVWLRNSGLSGAALVSLTKQGGPERHPRQPSFFFSANCPVANSTDFLNSQLHAVCIHPALGMMMNNYTWQKLFFTLGLSIENDHWLQLCTIGQAGKDNSQERLLMASRSYGDSFFSLHVLTVLVDGISNQTGVSSILPMFTRSWLAFFL